MTLPPQLNRLQPAPATWDPVFYTQMPRPSAVLVLFIVPTDATKPPSVVVIRRSTRVGSHRGQIGFPGGRLEATDTNPAATALRETAEELGIAVNKVQIKGILPPVPALDGGLVFPVIGVIAEADCFIKPSPSEVQEVHLVSWLNFGIQNRQRFSFNMFGCWRDSFLYDCGEITVWGLSAEILAKAAFREEHAPCVTGE